MDIYCILKRDLNVFQGTCKMPSLPLIMCVPYIGDVQYIGRISWVHWGYLKYIRRCSVHRGDIMICMWDMSTLGVFSGFKSYHEHIKAYHEYSLRCLVRGGISWYTLGILQVNWGVFITLGGYHECIRGYHNSCEGAYWWNHLFCIEDPNVVVISTNVLNTSRCTRNILHRYHDIPPCILKSPMHWTSSWYLSYVLNTHHEVFCWEPWFTGLCASLRYQFLLSC